MSDFQYVVWFRDHRIPPDEQDHEWPACFFVVGDHEQEALSWGNQLAWDYCERHPEYEFRQSYLDPDPWADEAAPKVRVGEFVPDTIIGW